MTKSNFGGLKKKLEENLTESKDYMSYITIEGNQKIF
jgi:hypothetical protein